MATELTKQQAEERNALSNWTFATDSGDVTVKGMTENQARMFAPEKVDCRIGELLRVTAA